MRRLVATKISKPTCQSPVWLENQGASEFRSDVGRRVRRGTGDQTASRMWPALFNALAVESARSAFVGSIARLIVENQRAGRAMFECHLATCSPMQDPGQRHCAAGVFYSGRGLARCHIDSD